MNAMKVAFRVDSSTCIGSGHVMRCLVLANELRNKGISSKFVCRNFEGNLALKIMSDGHQVSLLGCTREPQSVGVGATFSDYESWLGDDPNADALATCHSLLDYSPSWLIIDHYAINSGWERALREALNVKIMVVDGLANRAHDCDLLLDPTYSPRIFNKWHGLVPEECRLLVGPRFALLRPEFYLAKQRLLQRDGQVRRIFVTFGGMDTINATGLVVSMLNSLSLDNVFIDVVIAEKNLHRTLIESRCAGRDNVKIHSQPSDMAELMLRADLAISSGGGVVVEQCFLELPTIAFSVADNQTAALISLADAGVIQFAGSLLESQVNETIEAARIILLSLISSPRKLLDMQHACREIMPGTDNPISYLISKIARK